MKMTLPLYLCDFVTEEVSLSIIYRDTLECSLGNWYDNIMHHNFCFELPVSDSFLHIFIVFLLNVYILNWIVAPQILYVEALIPKMTMFGYRAFKE